MYINKLFDEIKQNAFILGNQFIYDLISDIDCDDEKEFKELYLRLKEYNGKLEIESYIEEDDNDDDELEDKGDDNKESKFVWLQDKYINVNNIDRIELSEYYSHKKNKIIYSITFYKKWVDTYENSYSVDFVDEDSREFWLNILRIKCIRLNVKIF